MTTRDRATVQLTNSLNNLAALIAGLAATLPGAFNVDAFSERMEKLAGRFQVETTNTVIQAQESLTPATNAVEKAAISQAEALAMLGGATQRATDAMDGFSESMAASTHANAEAAEAAYKAMEQAAPIQSAATTTATGTGMTSRLVRNPDYETPLEKKQRAAAEAAEAFAESATEANAATLASTTRSYENAKALDLFRNNFRSLRGGLTQLALSAGGLALAFKGLTDASKEATEALHASGRVAASGPTLLAQAFDLSRIKGADRLADPTALANLTRNLEEQQFQSGELVNELLRAGIPQAGAVPGQLQGAQSLNERLDRIFDILSNIENPRHRARVAEILGTEDLLAIVEQGPGRIEQVKAAFLESSDGAIRYAESQERAMDATISLRQAFAPMGATIKTGILNALTLLVKIASPVVDMFSKLIESSDAVRWAVTLLTGAVAAFIPIIAGMFIFNQVRGVMRAFNPLLERANVLWKESAASKTTDTAASTANTASTNILAGAKTRLAAVTTTATARVRAFSVANTVSAVRMGVAATASKVMAAGTFVAGKASQAASFGVRALGVAIKTALGPIGLIFAAMEGLSFLMGKFSDNTDDAAQSTDELLKSHKALTDEIAKATIGGDQPGMAGAGRGRSLIRGGDIGSVVALNEALYTGSSRQILGAFSRKPAVSYVSGPSTSAQQYAGQSLSGGPFTVDDPHDGPSLRGAAPRGAAPVVAGDFVQHITLPAGSNARDVGRQARKGVTKGFRDQNPHARIR